ncbi:MULTISPECIES: methyltransferase family protein [Aphanothece]|uniref:methyltransferase family protein n=1 Tax=Aphanothece TaxID=1121 RepID=UPI0039855E99
MQLRHVINLHKGLTPFVVAGLMVGYGNMTLGPWVYLALHGTYGLIWLLKDAIFPDRQWQQPIAWPVAVLGFLMLGLYWIAPFLLISSGLEPPLPLVAAAIACNILGVFLHFCSDAQKHFTLQVRPGLITEGFFARSRNTNYLGELLIYLSFALLAMHWLPYLVLAGFGLGVFLPNMRRKDASLARYPAFEAYRERSGLLLPSLQGSRQG